MRFERLVTLVTFLAVLTAAVRVSTDTDTWWHLRSGATIVDQRQIIRTDPFSLTRQGQAWVYPGWIAQLTIYAVYTALGFAGLNMLTAVMVTLAFACVWKAVEAPGLLKAFVILLAATTSAVYWSARPQIFSFALAGVFIWVLEQGERGKRRYLLALPPLMALWANVHGGFAIGFLLLFAYGVGACTAWALPIILRIAGGEGQSEPDFQRKWISSLIATGLLCAVAVTINPHGPAMLRYPFRTLSIGVLRDYIQEWQSPNFHALEVQPFLWMLILTMVIFAISPRRPLPRELVLVGGFASMSLIARRNIALFALATTPSLIRHGDEILRGLPHPSARRKQLPERVARLVNLVLFTALLVAASVKILLPLSEDFNRKALEANLPVQAVAYIREERPAGPLFNSYNWGGYVLWMLYPDYLSFVDGRTDLFDDEILEEYLAAWRADSNWQQIVDRWGINLALLEVDAPLAKAMEEHGWAALFRSEMAVVLARSR